VTDAKRADVGDGDPVPNGGFGKPASDSAKQIATQPVAHSWREFIKVDPAAETQRPLNEGERRGLEGDLKRDGLREPVVLRVLEEGGEPRLLDGRHRLDLLEKLGIEVVDAGGKLIAPHRIVIIADDADAVSQVLSLNFYRRHLDIKECRALVKAMLKNQPEKSDRLIGRILDLSHPTIAKDRKELEAAGEVVKISTSTDWRGRKQPARRAQPEAQIQHAVFQHLRMRGAPHVFAFHPANGGYRKPIEAAIMKGLGVVAGTPDVIAIKDGHVFALELKAAGGRPSPKQIETIAALEAAGAITAIAVGLDAAHARLEAWGLLRGRSS
jgi:hypothetical protein